MLIMEVETIKTLPELDAALTKVEHEIKVYEMSLQQAKQRKQDLLVQRNVIVDKQTATKMKQQQTDLENKQRAEELECQQRLEELQIRVDTPDARRQAEIKAYQDRIAELRRQILDAGETANAQKSSETTTVTPNGSRRILVPSGQMPLPPKSPGIGKRIIRVIKKSKSPGNNGDGKAKIIQRVKVAPQTPMWGSLTNSNSAPTTPSSSTKEDKVNARPENLPSLLPLDGDDNVNNNTNNSCGSDTSSDGINDALALPESTPEQSTASPQSVLITSQQQQHSMNAPSFDPSQGGDSEYLSQLNALKKKHAWSKPAWAMSDDDIPDDQAILSDPISNPFLKSNNHSGYVRKVFPKDDMKNANGKFVDPSTTIKLAPRLAWIVVFAGDHDKIGKIVVHLYGKDVDGLVDHFLDLKNMSMSRSEGNGLLTVADIDPQFYITTTTDNAKLNELDKLSGVYGVVQEGCDVVEQALSASENGATLLIKQAHIYPVKKAKGM